MTSLHGLVTGRWLQAWAALGAVCFVCAAGSGWAKTPDGSPPSAEVVCAGMAGAAFGLCNAYCEAQDCDVHPRPSCPVLRRNFQKLTGSAVFPCDRRCGNGTIDRGEDCDPPGSPCENGDSCTADCTCPAPICGNGTLDPGEDCDPPGSPCADGVACRPDCTCPAPICGNGTLDPGEDCDPPGSPCADGVTCRPDCTCPAPVCGDGVVEGGEECDPPGSLCTTGVPCSATCSCVTEPTGCCECPNAPAAMCQEGVTRSACLANGCLPGAAGTVCDPALGRCVPPTTTCCQCGDNGCVTATAPDACPVGCAAAPSPSTCDAAGTCQPVP